MEENVKAELKKFSDYVEHHLGHIVTRDKNGNFELLDSLKMASCLSCILSYVKQKFCKNCFK